MTKRQGWVSHSDPATWKPVLQVSGAFRGRAYLDPEGRDLLGLEAAPGPQGEGQAGGRHREGWHPGWALLPNRGPWFSYLENQLAGSPSRSAMRIGSKSGN